jgi:hypothetical protein
MKPFTTLFNHRLLVALVAAWGMGQRMQAADATAFELIKEGDRHVGEEAKGRVVQIRSEKSIGTLTPNIWYVVYYDPDATAKATEIKFAAGKKISVKRPARIIELSGSSHHELPKDKLKIDSDKALEIAQKEPILEKLTLKASRLTLERWGYGNELPVWKVRFWAARLDNPNKMADIGEVFVSSDDGKVVKNDLKPNRVD